MADTTEKKLIISNGNDGQIPFLIRLYESLYDPDLGKYTGHFLFLSDNLSQHSLNILDDSGIPYHLLDREITQQWETVLKSEKHALGKVAKPFFIREAIRLASSEIECVMYLDPDILVQKPLDIFFEQITDTKVFYSRQEKSMQNIPWAVLQLDRALQNGRISREEIDNYPFEINTGFMVGSTVGVLNFLNELIAFMTNESFSEFASSDPSAARPNAWHDQDFFRCFIRKNENYKKIILTPPAQVVHMCNNVYRNYRLKTKPLGLRHASTNEVPNIVHFAGGVWVEFICLSIYYYGYAHGIAAFFYNILLPIRKITFRIYRTGKRWLKRFLRQIKKRMRSWFK